MTTNLPRYDFTVVNYDRRGFARLFTSEYEVIVFNKITPLFCDLSILSFFSSLLALHLSKTQPNTGLLGHFYPFLFFAVKRIFN